MTLHELVDIIWCNRYLIIPRPTIDCRQGQGLFSLPPLTFVGPIQPPNLWVPGVKRLEREANNSHIQSVLWSRMPADIPKPPTRFQGVTVPRKVRTGHFKKG